MGAANSANVAGAGRACPGKTRTYFIAADEVQWDYAPSGTNLITGEPFDDDACDYTGAQELAEVWPGAELALTDGLGHRMICQTPSVIDRIVDFVA